MTSTPYLNSFNIHALKGHEKTVLTVKMLEVGIVPVDNVQHDVKRTLDQVSPKEARKMKRKFRKLWRKQARQAAKQSGAGDVKNWMGSVYGAGKRTPSRWQRVNRKTLVQSAIYRDVVRPIIDKFERGEPKKR